MNKHFSLTIFLLLLMGLCSAQDQLFKKDNSKLKVKIIEIGINEIKYKLFDNLEGPLLSIKKEEVSLILFENGKHEVVTTRSAETDVFRSNKTILNKRQKFHRDSLQYFKYNRSLSMNFLNFTNNEIGFIFQREFINKSFNVIIPFSFGVEQPEITNSTYFRNYNYFSNGSSSFQLTRKMFEIGLGINYYTSLRSSVNYYVGPVVKYIRYNAEQNFTTFNGSRSFNIKEYSQLIRYVGGISNGIVIRTSNRIILNMFISIGYKYDQVTNMIYNPVNNESIDPISKNLGLYFWTGLCVGYSF